MVQFTSYFLSLILLLFVILLLLSFPFHLTERAAAAAVADQHTQAHRHTSHAKSFHENCDGVTRAAATAATAAAASDSAIGDCTR